MRTGSCYLMVLCGAVALLSDVRDVRAEQSQGDSQTYERPHLSVERRQELYEQARLTHSTAIKRSLLVPGLGNIYADRVFKGMLLMGGAGMSLGVLVGGALRRDRLFMISGGVALTGIYSFAAVSSYYDVSAYNTELRSRYKVQLAPTWSAAQRGLALRFEF